MHLHALLKRHENSIGVPRVECIRGSVQAEDITDAPGSIRLQLLEEGSAFYVVGGRKVAAVTRRLSVLWSAIPNQVFTAGETIQLYVAHLPLAKFLSWKLPDPFTQRLWQGYVVSEPSNRRGNSDLLALQQWALDLQCDASAIQKAALLEMEARVLRLAKDVIAEGYSRTVDAPDYGADVETPAERMGRFIAQHFNEPVSSHDVVAVSGLSEEVAANIFAHMFGMGVEEYLTRYRLAYAQRLLITTCLPLANVASRSGFESMARFSQCFRHSIGMTALEYRRMILPRRL